MQHPQQEHGQTHLAHDEDQSPGGAVPRLVGLLASHHLKHEHDRDDEGEKPSQMPTKQRQRLLADAEVGMGQTVGHRHASQEA